MSSIQCPFCSNLVLRHVDRHHVYWFCRHCYQEVPILDLNRSSQMQEKAVLDANPLKTLF